MLNLNKAFKTLLGLLAITVMLASRADMAQTPLLTQSTAVEPNFVFMLDDSGSMYYGSIYEYGGGNNYLGVTGPSDKTYAAYSPDVNKIYYDPRIRYKVRVNADGSSQAPGATNVYVVDQSCDPQVKKSACENASAPETSTDKKGTYTIKVYFRNGSGPYTTESVNPLTAYFSPSYAPPAAEVVAGSAAVYPNESTSILTIFPKFINRTDCMFPTFCTWFEERQNYANWLAYHSNRMAVAKTGIGLAFQPLGPSFRLGWATINELDGQKRLVSGVQLYDSSVRQNFLNWLYAFDNSKTPSSTPNLDALNRVGIYYSRRDDNGPWSTNPITKWPATHQHNVSITSNGPDVVTHLSCRRSYSLLMTDGYYNTSAIDSLPGTPFASGAPGNTDGTAVAAIPRPPGSTAATFSYTPALPFKDSYDNTMADIAFKYWVTDLRPDLENRVPTLTGKQSNESYWQNMTFYAIGMGVTGSLPQTQATLDNLATTPWPKPVAARVTAIDDMWHATVNSRGKMLSAKNADELSTSLQQMMAEVTKITASQSGVAASTISLTNGTKKYIPKYTTNSWTGNIVSRNLDPASGAELSTGWQVVGTDPATGISYNGIPDSATRKIYAWNSTAYGNFDKNNRYLTDSKTGLDVDKKTSASDISRLIDYLRGDQRNEYPNGTSEYRSREVVLGDIVNSTPTFIKDGLDMNYEKLPAGNYGQASYRVYVTAKASRSEGVLFAGANDGMLHGFRESTGAEAFAFVPKAVMPKLHLLADNNYVHQYYVDGPTVEADACLTGGIRCSSWSNLLLGTAGAGAKTVFALDVTSLATGPTMGLGATNVKWEITSDTKDYDDLGFILSDLQTGLAANGKWVAVFGNGYEGKDGKAHLYVADLATGALIKDIQAGDSKNNGLGGVRLVRDANQRIIGAYAGDLSGSLWKFDLSASDDDKWSVGLDKKPLYQGSSAQPITAAPAVVTHPKGGSVVVFGTGKFFEPSDLSTVTTQSLYGIWDSVAFGSSTTPSGVTVTGRTKLQQQTISAAMAGSMVLTNADLTTTTSALNYYSVSRNTVDWASKRGWYIDFALNAGQRVVNPVELLVGKFVAIDSMSPSNVSLDPCLQKGTGLAWNYVIDGVSGSGPAESIFDTNGDKLITSADLLVSGYENTADGRTRHIKNISKSTSSMTWFTPLATEQLPSIAISCGLLGTCQGNGIVKRSWRQLFLR